MNPTIRLAEHRPEERIFEPLEDQSIDLSCNEQQADDEFVAADLDCRPDPALLDEQLRLSDVNTDVGNAALFFTNNRLRARFCDKWGKWLIYDGTRWKIDDRNEIVRLAKQTAIGLIKTAAKEPDDNRRERLLTRAKSLQKRDRLNAMVELSKPELAIVPDELDGNPMLLNVKNGTIDLRSGKLRAHRRDDFITKICNASFDPRAPRPTYTHFLQRIFRTYPALIAFMQKAGGYSITAVTSEQALFFLFGTGGNGKTVLIDSWLNALGDYASKADRDLLTAITGQQAAHPTNVADLMGRRLVVCSESNEGARFDEAKLKDLVGETQLKARFMRCDFFDFVATHKLFLYSNHKPNVRGTDHGFWRRMRLIPFVETISETERDTGLAAKLEREADGILAWLVEGCLRWQREGLGLPDEVAQATDGYRKEMDSIGAFIDELCVVASKAETSSKNLYGAYQRWCEDAGEQSLSQKRLGLQLAERGFESGRDSYTNRKKWVGIGLKALAQSEKSDDRSE